MIAFFEHRLARWATIFVVALLAFCLVPVALPGLQGPAGIWVSRILLAFALTLNVGLITYLPFRTQVLVSWFELVALFLLFFYSFDLSYEFIFSRLRFLLGFGLDGIEMQRGFVIGAVLTLFICFVSIAFSMVLALSAALMRLSKNGLAVGISGFYISFFRGTPLLLQILLIYLGLPQIGIILSPIPSAIIALSLCYGAYMAEIFRAGIQAVPMGQREAARALGLGEALIMRLVVLPQALRLIIPPTGNQFIAMLKDSSLVSVLGAWDLMYMAQTHGKAEFKYVEMLITAALIYWVLSGFFEMVQARIERRMGKGVRVD